MGPQAAQDHHAIGAVAIGAFELDLSTTSDQPIQEFTAHLGHGRRGDVPAGEEMVA
jgi:hypothetical protein